MFKQQIEVRFFFVFDLQGENESRWRLKAIESAVVYCPDEYAAVEDSDVTVILTMWNQFRSLNPKKMKALMKDNYFFDFRNIYERKTLEEPRKQEIIV